MLHPHTKLAWISDAKEFGVVATQRIPMGTITFAQDPLDIRISVDSPLLVDERYREVVEKYSYMNCEGEFVISWDHGKYMNHCCFSNTLTTGYGFEIAIRDIEEGEEVTDDYGIFTIRHHMAMSCSKQNCRKVVSIDAFETLESQWDDKIINALKQFNDYKQPLDRFLTDEIATSLTRYLATGEGYLSVENQKPRAKEIAIYEEQKAE